MPYRIAGVDVHKKMLAVAVADVEVDGEWQFERRQFGTSPSELRALAGWLVNREVEEVVMESTAQYWRPVWETLEECWQAARRMCPDAANPGAGELHLAQAQSNEGAHGRKKDFPDAERLVKRLVAQELTLSFVPDATQRLWRTVTRRKYQLTGNRVQLRNRLECLLEEAHIKISSLVSDLLGPSARRMLQAVADGDTDAATIVNLGSPRLHATPDQLRDALGACMHLDPVYRRLLHMMLEELQLIDAHVEALDHELARLLREHQNAVQRLAAVPGLGVDSAQQIIAEVGPSAATFPTAKHLASWAGACPGHEESAGMNHSHRSPHGNRQMRRLLNQAANAAVKTKGSLFEVVYRRLVVRLGHNQAIGAVAHRLCRLVWKILHAGVTYEERGPAVTKARALCRAQKMIRELRKLGYRVEGGPAPASSPA
jgi:transposase